MPAAARADAQHRLPGDREAPAKAPEPGRSSDCRSPAAAIDRRSTSFPDRAPVARVAPRHTGASNRFRGKGSLEQHHAPRRARERRRAHARTRSGHRCRRAGRALQSLVGLIDRRAGRQRQLFGGDVGRRSLHGLRVDASNLVAVDTNGPATPSSAIPARARRRASRSRRPVQSGDGSSAERRRFGRRPSWPSCRTRATWFQETNGLLDVFVRDREAGITSRVSVVGRSRGRRQELRARDLRRRALRRVQLGRHEPRRRPERAVPRRLRARARDRHHRVGVDAASRRHHRGPSYQPSLSRDGRYVAFASQADLMEGDTNLPPTCSCATGCSAR